MTSITYPTAKRIIITGCPGAGKTSIINLLEAFGESVIHEAARDIIQKELKKGENEPWLKEGFREKIVSLQNKRQFQAGAIETNRFFLGRTFFDRSPIDTLTYCLLFKATPTPMLIESVQKILSEDFYDKTVYLIQNLGFTEIDNVRSESQEESLVIEKLLEETYQKLGFRVVLIAKASVEKRVEKILHELGKKLF